MSNAADKHCSGRLLYFHEGGYSAAYVPFCGLAVMEQLSGLKTQMQDVFLADTAVGGQALQPWQEAVIKQVEAVPLALLQQKVAER
jgi:acetoin utilization deacetylase AcuC-like enzyme